MKFGIVLYHPQVQIELWLVGRNSAVKTEYWEMLRNSKWNQGITEMSIYSVLEICLENNIDFSKKDDMTEVDLGKYQRSGL